MTRAQEFNYQVLSDITNDNLLFLPPLTLQLLFERNNEVTLEAITNSFFIQ